MQELSRMLSDVIDPFSTTPSPPALASPAACSGQLGARRVGLLPSRACTAVSARVNAVGGFSSGLRTHQHVPEACRLLFSPSALQQSFLAVIPTLLQSVRPLQPCVRPLHVPAAWVPGLSRYWRLSLVLRCHRTSMPFSMLVLRLE